MKKKEKEIEGKKISWAEGVHLRHTASPYGLLMQGKVNCVFSHLSLLCAPGNDPGQT